MRATIGAALVVGLAATWSSPARANPDERPTIQWANSWEEAVEEATARNVPIFVTFHQDG